MYLIEKLYLIVKYPWTEKFLHQFIYFYFSGCVRSRRVRVSVCVRVFLLSQRNGNDGRNDMAAPSELHRLCPFLHGQFFQEFVGDFYARMKRQKN